MAWRMACDQRHRPLSLTIGEASALSVGRQFLELLAGKPLWVKASGIATAPQNPQVVLEHDTGVEQGCQELVANWHRLMPPVRDAIMGLVRSSPE
jgi:hypothetical protein